MTDLPVMKSKSYADFLVSKGEMVYELGSIPWMKYHGALIPATAMPVYENILTDDAAQLIKKSKALLLRYTNGPVKTPTNWWNMVCRHYNFNDVSSSTRSKIRRGIKRNEIKQVNTRWIYEQAYDCHVECYKRYNNALPEDRPAYESFLNDLRDQPIFNIWACFNNQKLSGYIICLVEKNGVFLHTIDITPAGLKDYAAYALINNVLDYYTNIKELPVSNGSRSISHETDMQDFLCKFGFEKEYSELYVVYRPDIKILVNFLYPFRNMLKLFKKIPLVHKVSAVLYQEEIVRQKITNRVVYD